MCVNVPSHKKVCKKTAQNLVVLDFCINTHTHTHTHNPLYVINKKVIAGQAVMNEYNPHLNCGLLCYVYTKQSLI